jgi:ATP-dependent Lon protease
MLKLPDGTVKVLVEGTQRARIDSIEDVGTHFQCELTPIAAETAPTPSSRRCAARSWRSSTST